MSQDNAAGRQGVAGDTAAADNQPQLSPAEAKRLIRRIGWRLNGLARPVTALLPHIREAIDRDAAGALGYSSVAEWSEDRFGLGSESIAALLKVADQLRDRSGVR
jgi:hypothetical protein